MTSTSTGNTSTVNEENNTHPLFAPLTIRGVTLRNRIAVSPMCQYSAEDGFANDWHFVHLGSRAVGGAGLIMVEKTAVEERGRITPEDLGIYRDEHVEMLSRITAFIRSQGGVPAIQLGHAGRKASTYRPWSGDGELTAADGRWQTVGPSAVRFTDNYPMPHELTIDEVAEVVLHYQQAALRAVKAGFQVLEIHGAHGYLVHQFLSPLSNKRDDIYGGSLKNRMRFLLEITDTIRSVIPENMPLFVRLSATDWTEGGLTSPETVEIARALKEHGIDLVDTSTGGNVATAKIPVKPGYQVPFAEEVRRDAQIATGAVGLITEAQQANEIILNQQADMVFLAREFLRDPYWPLHAAQELGAEIRWPDQYLRAKR
ncbi:MAG TPA: NADH:flavin oxidoreductase/NADH oxidase [Dictyobacter sp.]|jgi:2,4-dienoyl-CoA reductase-like NADH-dependent reductase (Old Yellow Enzyme family)|nr:NADH:flavin oxidoreductase/NADH oxidase [Dictyobacter sp.]